MGSTWPNLQVLLYSIPFSGGLTNFVLLCFSKETVQYDRAPSNNMVMNERPHTISTAYEKGHQRPALSVYTFQPLEHSAGQSCSSSSSDKFDRTNNSTPTGKTRPLVVSAYHKFQLFLFQTESPEYETLRRCRELKCSGNGSSQESLGTTVGRPPLPQRCSSLERPVVPAGKTKEKVNKKNSLVLQPDKNNQQQQQPGTTASVLPDFHQAAPDMSKSIPLGPIIWTWIIAHCIQSIPSSLVAPGVKLPLLLSIAVVPQPVYMNASELRCQQQQQACNGDDPASHAIYTSLASCTVYEDGQGKHI